MLVLKSYLEASRYLFHHSRPHSSNSPPSQLLYVGEPFYLATITIAKLQLLTFYHETFRRTSFATYFRVGFVFVLSTNLGLLVADIVQCIPISANWEWVTSYMSPDSPSPAANCVDISLLITTAGGLNILQELLIVGLFLYPVVFVLPFSSKERRYKAAAGVTVLSFSTVGASC